MCIDCQRMTKGVVVRTILSKEWPCRSLQYAIVIAWFFQVDYDATGPSYKVVVIHLLTLNRAAAVAY